ncbi:ScyD/ScyE family protein [Nocardioides anomalus]|uniref:ScyD/ScyE family protein n=1 Tax=Nocardioides anomalus TaxID=2712223 RepID=A0A6G6WFY9_9ACTN|nr:ScyD/ScyE family protein [Nocardioides anomalus]QIG44126.1 ScyD/ScyE family protein [Nocardioides anomalus]
MRHRHLVAAAAALLLAAGTAGSAHGAPGAVRAKPSVTPVAKHLVGPLSVAQAPDGTRYWTDSFAGPLYRQLPGGQPTVVFPGSKKFTAEAVSADGGVLRFATSHNNKVAHVWTLDAAGAPVAVADTFAYEKANNPDGRFTYGFLKTPKSCLAQLPKQIPGSYQGSVESHPYATASANGTTYVADAGANAILAISATGTVSTVAALKPVKVKVSASAAKANKLPSCVVGKKFALEAVPTDVEVGPDGQLYVTSLPGGPEDASLGLNGRVLRVDPATGAVSEVVGGLLSPTGVAVAANGDVYVAQLFPGVISRIAAGSHQAKTYAKVPFPAAVEATPTALLATVNALPGKGKPRGQVVTITP